MVETHGSVESSGKHGSDIPALGIWATETFRPTDEYCGDEDRDSQRSDHGITTISFSKYFTSMVDSLLSEGGGKKKKEEIDY